MIMNVLHIHTNDYTGGASAVAKDLVKWQRANGHSSSMLVGYKESGDSWSYPFDIGTNTAAAAELKSSGWLDFEYEGSRGLASNPLVQEADLLHLHNLHGYYFHPAALQPLTSSKPTLWTLHDMQSITGHCAHSFECGKWETGCPACPDLNTYPRVLTDNAGPLWTFKKEIYDRSSFHVAVPSLWLKKKAEKSILKNHPIRLIYNGIDTDIFSPHPSVAHRQALREKYGIAETTLVVGGSANGGLSNPYKGGQYAEEVIRRCGQKFDDFLFLNIGGDASSPNPNIRNMGYIHNKEELRDVYSLLDLFLFTSVADNCPLVILEAMSMGIPIVGFATGGVPELVRDGEDGYLVAPRDAESLTERTLSLLQDRERRRLFSRESRRRAERHFSLEAMNNAYQSAYSDVIQSPERLTFHSVKRTDARPRPSVKSKLIIVFVGKERHDSALLFDQARESLSDLYEVERWTESRLASLELGANDLVWPIHSEMNVQPQDLPFVLYDAQDADFIWTDPVLRRRSGKKFYKPLRIDLEAEPGLVRLSTRRLGAVIFSGSFFNIHIAAILNGHPVQTNVGRQKHYHTVMVNLFLDNHVREQLRTSGADRFYLYGAGGHTSELLRELEGNTAFEGIVDSNPSLSGKEMAGLPVVNIEQALSDEKIGILISSSSYEQEIFERLASIGNNPIIRIYRERE